MSRSVRMVVGLMIAMIVASSAYAGQEPQTPQTEAGQEPQTKAEGPKDPLGLGFGLGLGLQWNLSGPDLVGAASVNGNGVVTVDKRMNTTSTLVGELHAFPWTWGHDLASAKNREVRKFGIGPFVAVQSGSDKVVEAVGVGVMLGVRTNENRRGFGLGVGYAAQASKTVLPNGFVEGAKAPIGPDGKPLPLKLKEADNGALMAIVSVVF